MRIPRPTSDAPKIKLTDILRRRKVTLQTWAHQSGIQTYEQLTRHCKVIGARPPSVQDWEASRPVVATVQTEGIVHIDVAPIVVIDEQTGELTSDSFETETPDVTLDAAPVKPTKNRTKRSYDII